MRKTKTNSIKNYFDVNCEEEPNILGKDQFVLPLGERGINYE